MDKAERHVGWHFLGSLERFPIIFQVYFRLLRNMGYHFTLLLGICLPAMETGRNRTEFR